MYLWKRQKIQKLLWSHSLVEHPYIFTKAAGAIWLWLRKVNFT